MRTQCLNLRNACLEEVVNEVDVSLNILQHLLAPLLTILECRNSGNGREDGRLAEFVGVEPLEERATQLLVGHNAVRADYTGNVECLRRCSEGDAALGCTLRNRRKRMVLESLVSHVAVYLVRNDDDATLRTEVGKAAQGVYIPYDASRIVRIGEYQHAALLVSHLGKTLEVHRVRSVLVHDERIHHHLTLVAQRSEAERMVYRRLDDYLLVGLAEHVDNEAYALDDARNESHPFAVDIPLMMVGNPSGHRRPEVGRHIGVSVERVVETAAQCVGDKLRSLEVHVCHPHRRKVRSAVAFVEYVNSQSTRAVAVDDFVEVVFCRHINMYACYFYYTTKVHSYCLSNRQ